MEIPCYYESNFSDTISIFANSRLKSLSSAVQLLDMQVCIILSAHDGDSVYAINLSYNFNNDRRHVHAHMSNKTLNYISSNIVLLNKESDGTNLKRRLEHLISFTVRTFKIKNTF